jgi:hypothetical protein
MAACREKETVETDAEHIGPVFPVYCSDLPVLAQEFAGKIGDLPASRSQG